VNYLSSVPIIPGPSGNSPPESVINPALPPLGFKVADQWVAGDFEVGYVRRMKPIIMLGPRSTVVGGFKLNLNHYQNLLSDVLSRALQYQKRYTPFTNLYQLVSDKIHSGPGYRNRKCSKMKQIYKRFDQELNSIHQLGEKFTNQVSPLKLESLFNRLHILDIEFDEHFAQLRSLRIQSKRFCHKCPKQTQLKNEPMENYCFSKFSPTYSHAVAISSCCYTPSYAHVGCDETLTFSESYSPSQMCATPCVKSNTCILASCTKMKFKMMDSNLFVHPQMKMFSKKVIRGKWKKRFLSRECKKINICIIKDPSISKNLHFLLLVSFLLHVVDQTLRVNPQHFSKYEYNVWLELLYRAFVMN